MSSKKTKSDLLVKTRYLNPIPAPACPPQTIEIPTDLGRMGKADLTSAYAASLPMPMMVDSEIGMPLDLNACEGIWWDEVDPAFNPVRPVPLDQLHPDDAGLLEMPNIVLGAGGSGTQHQLPGTAGRPRIRVEETWLRGTTYMGKNDGSKAPTIAKVADVQEIEVPDASMLSQLQTIERSFWQHEQFTDESIKNLRHPTKKGVTAVDAFDVLPDEDVWSGHYNQINFPERPTDKESNKVTNEQLLASIFRPRAVPIKGFQSYVPLEEDLQQWHKIRHHVLEGDEDRDYTNVVWDHVRMPFLKDYEIVEQDHRQAGATDQIIVLSFCDGEKMSQQDELAALASSSAGAGVNGSAGETKTPKIEEEEEDDDDDIFGDKEIEQEEEAEAKKEEVEDMSTRVKAKGKGVYFVELNSTVNVKRMRTINGRNYQQEEDNWDALTLAYQHATERQRQRREDHAKFLEPEWLQEELHAEMPDQDRAGEAMGDTARL